MDNHYSQMSWDSYAGSHVPRKHRMRSPNSLIYIVGVILLMGIVLTVLNIYELQKMKEDHNVLHNSLTAPEGREGMTAYKQPVVWVAGKNLESGYLKHVLNVFERIGYVVGNEESSWDVLWAHDYPFITFVRQISNLKPHQKVNHFPGSGYITNKASLSATKMKFIPRAFRVPADIKKFKQYAREHANTKWVQKSNHHRGIEIKDIKDLDLTRDETFIQEYVSKPFLVDGRKFDIGVYVILTSISPLRVYIVDSDALFRFCLKPYYPFDYKIAEKYVVKDDYTPMWELPSLKKLYEEMGYSFIQTFNTHLESKGLNYRKVWNDIKSAILTVYQEKESKLVEAAWKYKTTRNFFEMVRFDFVLDENLNVYLMEANMSPNLSSVRFTRNRLLYEHVIFNLFSLVGLAQFTSGSYYTSPDDELEMQVSDHDIQVFPETCSSPQCQDHCTSTKCQLCNKCLSTEWRTHLKLSYLEHVRRGSCRRIFPQPINQTYALSWNADQNQGTFTNTSSANHLMSLWFLGKCRVDSAFCT